MKGTTMKKLLALLIATLVILSGAVFTAGPASAMPCNGPGCDGNSYTGYPGGKKPDPDPLVGGVFRSPRLHAPVKLTYADSKPVVNINCYTGIKTKTTVRTFYIVSKNKLGRSVKNVLLLKPTYLKRPVSKKECPVKLRFNPAGH